MECYGEYTLSGTVSLERWTLQLEGIAQVDTLTKANSQVVTSPVPVVRYQYREHLGSSTIEANELGQVISYEEYYPYGRSAYRAAASGVDLSLKRYRFTGKERDEETGLDYFGVRYYAPWLGRWTSGDPGGFVDGLNLYRYVKNNPVNGVDLEGYQTEPPPEGCPDCYKTNKLPLDSTNKTAFFYGRQAGLSFQNIIAKLNNQRLLDYYREDPENNKWIFQLEGRRFTTGLQSETAQTWEKIAAFGIGVPLATPAVVQGGVAFAQTFALSNVVGATTAKSFLIGFGVDMSLQLSSAIAGVGIGKTANFFADNSDEANTNVMTAFAYVDVGDAVISGLNPFNKIKQANLLFKVVAPALLDVNIGYNGFAIETTFDGSKSIKNTVGFGINNKILDNKERVGKWLFHDGWDVFSKAFVYSGSYTIVSGNGFVGNWAKNYEILK